MKDHGGNIYAASIRTGIPVERILDFSASIHFLGPPGRAVSLMKREMKNLSHYPEPFAEELSGQIGKNLGIDSKSVICGNGSTEILYLIPRALKPKRVLIPVPTFSEYERACSLNAGTKIVHHVLRREDSFDIDPKILISMMEGGHKKGGTRPFDMVFLCNPNNPTGRLLRKADVLRIAAAAKKIKCNLVVDEAFIDFHPEESVVAETQRNPHLIVVRSLTKFYALPGLRIGYGVFPLAIIEKALRHKEPWTVNTLAQKVGMVLLQNDAWQVKACAAMTKEKNFIEVGLNREGIDFIPSESNYYLLRTGNARAVIACLERKGILVRDCTNFAGLDDSYIRFAVCSRKENMILMKELAGLCGRR
jgi:threonine-phosphate decarboxylase